MPNEDCERTQPAPAAGPAPEAPAPAAFSHLERFAKAFEASARRWELVVYPSLFAFIVLAAYGFFLVYSLTKDIRILSANVDPEMNEHMAAMTSSIERLSDTIQHMNVAVTAMAGHINSMDGHIASIKEDTRGMSASTATMVKEMERVNAQMGVIAVKLNALDPIVVNMANMNESMKAMTVSTGLMSRDIGRPLNFMNQFMPW